MLSSPVEKGMEYRKTTKKPKIKIAHAFWVAASLYHHITCRESSLSYSVFFDGTEQELAA